MSLTSECCCRLAVKSGIKRDLAARHRLFLASRAALDGVTAVEVAEAVSSNNSGQEKWVLCICLGFTTMHRT